MKHDSQAFEEEVLRHRQRFYRFTFGLATSMILGVLITLSLIFNSGRAVGQEQQAEFPSFTPETVASGGTAKSIAAVDVNKDGNLDLIVTNQTNGTVSVLLGGVPPGIEFAPPFQLEALLEAGQQPRGVAVADFDKDGMLDIAVANWAPEQAGESTVRVFFQEEPVIIEGLDEVWVGDNIAFSDPVVLDVLKGPSDLVAVDANGDNIPDLVVVNTFSDSLSILLSQAPILLSQAQGNRSFTSAQHVPAGEGPQSIAAGLFNDDQFIDLAVANLFTRDVTLFFGDGEGSFAPAQPLPPPQFLVKRFAMDSSNTVDLAVGDLDGDGKLDVAFVYVGALRVDVFFGDGLGGLSEPASFPFGSSTPRAVTIGDVDGDGHQDLIVVDASGSQVRLLLGLGNRNFKDSINYSAGELPQDAATGFFNNHPGLDIFVTFNEGVFLLGSGGSPPVIDALSPTRGPLAGGNILIISGQNFDSGTTVTIGGNTPTAMLVVPANRIKLEVPPGSAGAKDVVVTNADGSYTAVGAFTYTSDPIPELALRFQRLVFCNASGGDQLTGIDACKINSTKDADPANFDGGGVDLYAGKTHSNSSAPTDEIYFSRSLGTPETGTFVDDLGVTRETTLATGLFEVKLVAPAQPNDNNSTQYDIQIADLDSDNDLDVVALDRNSVRILINNGTNNFTDETAARIGAMGTPGANWDDVDIGDVDLDGDLDVVAAARFDASNGHALLLNNGPPLWNFTVNLTLLGNTSSHDVDFADIDNDGDLDVVFSGNNGSQARIFRNNLVGTGIFDFTAVSSRLDPPLPDSVPIFFLVAAGRPIAPGDVPNARLVMPLDFNGDGLVDLFFGTSGSDFVYLNQASSPGFFKRLENFPSPGGFVYGASFGDLDLDGRIDIAQGDYDGQPMLYLNRITPGDSADEINAAGVPPFEPIPEPMRPCTPTGAATCAILPNAVGERREGLTGGTYWQSVTTAMPGGLDEPDLNKDNGLIVGTRTGFIVNFRQLLDIDLGDFDGDGDLDVSFGLGDHQDRANRIYLNQIEAPFPVITCPGGVTVECDESTDPSNTGAAAATDLIDPSPVVTFTDAETPGTCPQEKTITRTWTATNNRGKSSSCNQVISVVDTTPPIITCPADITVKCTVIDGTPVTNPAIVAFLAGATAADACDSSPTITNNAPAFFNEGTTTTVEFTATDDCGNASVCNADVRVEICCECPPGSPKGCISGTVTDSTGAPIEGKTVILILKPFNLYIEEIRRKAVTDSIGCYIFSDLEKGRYRVRVKGRCRPARQIVKIISGAKKNDVDFQCR